MGLHNPKEYGVQKTDILVTTVNVYENIGRVIWPQAVYMSIVGIACFRFLNGIACFGLLKWAETQFGIMGVTTFHSRCQ